MSYEGPQVLKDSWGGEVGEMPHQGTRAAAGAFFGTRGTEDGERVFFVE